MKTLIIFVVIFLAIGCSEASPKRKSKSGHRHGNDHLETTVPPHDDDESLGTDTPEEDGQRSTKSEEPEWPNPTSVSGFGVPAFYRQNAYHNGQRELAVSEGNRHGKSKSHKN